MGQVYHQPLLAFFGPPLLFCSLLNHIGHVIEAFPDPQKFRLRIQGNPRAVVPLHHLLQSEIQNPQRLLDTSGDPIAIYKDQHQYEPADQKHVEKHGMVQIGDQQFIVNGHFDHIAGDFEQQPGRLSGSAQFGNRIIKRLIRAVLQPQK
ncbi:hypothetical protein D3C75_895960 [compost metagenome]